MTRPMLQIQFVLSKKVFDPTVLCQDLHVCPTTSVGTLAREREDKVFLLRYRNFMQDLQVNVPLKHKDMPVFREGDLQGLLSGVLPVAPGGRGSGGKRSRKAGDKIRILQFSDVHLDHLYKEVWCSMRTCLIC